MHVLKLLKALGGQIFKPLHEHWMQPLGQRASGSLSLVVYEAMNIMFIYIYMVIHGNAIYGPWYVT